MATPSVRLTDHTLASTSPSQRPSKSWIVFPVFTAVSVLLLVALGLAVLDWQTGDGVWSPWAVWPLGVVSLALLLWAAGPLTGWGAHLLTYVLIMPELGLAQAVDTQHLWFPWTITVWGILVAAHGFVRFRLIGRLGAHTLATGVLIPLVIAWDVATDTVGWSGFVALGLGWALVIHLVVAGAHRARRPRHRATTAPPSPADAAVTNVRAALSNSESATTPLSDLGLPDQATRRFSFGARFVTWLTLAIILGGIWTGLVGINAVTSAGSWWVVWPSWGLLIVLAVSAGALLTTRPVLAAHVSLVLSVGFGLMLLNVALGGLLWFTWVWFGFALTLLLHGMIRWSWRQGRRLT